MKKLTFFAILLIFLVAKPVSAQDLELYLETTQTKIYAGKSSSIEVIVFNSQNFTDTFSITIWPTQFADVLTSIENPNLRISPKGNASTKIYFFASECADESTIQFEIVASSTTSNVSAVKKILLSVLRTFTVCISDFKLDKYGEIGPNESIRIITYLTNPTYRVSPQFFVQANIKFENKTIESFDEAIQPLPQKSTKILTLSYNFNEYASPGIYKIEVLLKDELNNLVTKKEETIRMKIVNKTSTQSWTDIGILSAVTTIKIKNEGNVGIPIRITTSIPSFIKNLFFPETQPTSEKTQDGWIEYEWNFENVNPGEEVIVKYEVKLLYVWLFCLGLVVVVILAFKFVYGPTVIKKYKPIVPALGKEITIALEIKNRSRHEIENVEVKDFVPTLFEVSNRFDTVRPETIKKVKGGTLLTWKFNLLKPLEERVLTYKIKPKMEISGTFKLPNAYMKYLDKKKEVKSIVSKSILIKPE
ncbi:MAG: hypothetical protein QXQ77_00350 [Candidatus Aenigmatarchaeota archaeon]